MTDKRDFLLPEACFPFIHAMDRADTCLHVIRDILLSINACSTDPQRVRHLVADALDEQEAASRLLNLEPDGDDA